MPEVSTWTASIPDVLELLKTDPRDCFTRVGVEQLLGIRARRAQEIMEAAGAVKTGRRYLLGRAELVMYLLVTGRDAIAQEHARKVRLAAKLTALRSQHIREPKMLVAMNTRECEMIYRRGLDTLPETITLSPGRIVVEGFSTGDEAKQMLMRLALAMATDEAQFDRIVEVKTEGVL